MVFKSRTWLKISACLGVFLILLGAVTMVFVNDIYSLIINETMVVSPDCVRYEPWRKSQYPLTFRVYLFNWTNPEEYPGGGRPRVVETGPYTYSEYDEKVDLQWHKNNTVSYRQSKLWYFDPGRSNGSLDDPITTADIVSLTAATLAEKSSYVFQRVVSVWCTLSSTHTVDELLFAGHRHFLLRITSSTSFLSGGSTFPYTKFGFFYMANGSSQAEGVFNMATGAGNVSEAGLLKRWNHSNRTGYFPGRCGQVLGSGGEMWPPWRTKNDTLWLFSKGLCTSLSLGFEEEALVEGIAGYRYVPDRGNFDRGGCYCHEGRPCPGPGVLDMAACMFGSPMYLSFPHFLGADPALARAVDGVRPDPRRHRFSVTIEPTTGIPLEILGRTQFNVMLEAKPNIRTLKSLPTTLLPVMWVEVAWRLDAGKAAELRLLVSLGRTLRACCLALLGLGAIAVAASVLLLARRPRRPDTPEELNKKTKKENNNQVRYKVPKKLNIRPCESESSVEPVGNKCR
ncbi:protein peste-like [Bacillus rossius redtenbacheri]|uniref:protein peste-like n=1 Tax=Bacillus rossius redtenbacheri TaxID=93214 RepID=UPI002FDD5DC6